jgi:hypothetical protein
MSSELDFGRLRSIAGCADQGVERGLRNLDDLGRNCGYAEIVISPEVAPDKGERVGGGRERFGIPRRRTRRRYGLAMEMLSPTGDQGEQPEQRGGGSSYCGVGSLALDAEVPANFGDGHFGRPAANEPAQDFKRVGVEIGAQERLRTEFASGVADQHVADRHEPARMAPKRGAGHDLDQAFATPIPAVHPQAAPSCLGIRKTFSQAGLPLSDHARPPDCAWTAPGRRVEQACGAKDIDADASSPPPR